jgi:hypothetical protein
MSSYFPVVIFQKKMNYFTFNDDINDDCNFLLTSEGVMVALSTVANVTCKHTAFVGVDQQTQKALPQHQIHKGYPSGTIGKNYTSLF